MSILFSHAQLGNITLKNRIVMSPLTRSRSIGNIPGELGAIYYGQRSGAGLIITEGTSPSPNGLGYARIPGIFSEEQINGWKKITEAVHAQSSRIFVQLMHTGRIGHPLNLPEGAEVLAPSAVKAAGEIHTDKDGMKPYPVPKAMTAEDIEKTKAEFVKAAKNAVAAGFDGVELHSANGYLLEQFLNPVTNVRTDNYGGSIENRARFVLEVVTETAAAIGKDKVGIRVSPYGIASDMPPYNQVDETYAYLAEELNKIGIVYVHVVDHSAMGAPAVSPKVKSLIRTKFKGLYILSGGYNKETAEVDLAASKGDLVAFGKPFINNPDLPARFENNWPLSKDLKMDLFYTTGAEGYTDYPTYQ